MGGSRVNEQFPLQPSAPLFDVAFCATQACSRFRTIPGLEVESDRHRAATWVFEQLHEWSRDHNPMGAPMTEAQQDERMCEGLQAVVNKAHNSARSGQVCGLPVLAIISLISALCTITKFILQWMRGEI